MCGIIGYVGKRAASEVIIKGLKKLEYRGYDSWGMALPEKDKLSVVKSVGRIGSIDPSKHGSSATIGIGHTRWATHGGVTNQNAHPHISYSGDIAVVHNGIIENHTILKEILLQEGVKFSSQTDTEVLAHLINNFYKSNIKEAVKNALLQVEGTYGLVVFHKKERKIVAARNGSPLVVGIGDKEHFIASDVAAIMEYTKQVVYLEDKDIAEISDESCDISNMHDLPINKKIETVTWNLNQIEKKGFKHFMLKEIHEQPETIKDSFRGRINLQEGMVNFGGLRELEEYFSRVKRIIITACGTSWHSALIGEYLIEKYAHVPVEVEYASEFRYRDAPLFKDDLVIVISQSGETTDTLAALSEAKKRGTKTLGIINVVGSTIARESERGIYIHAGPEIGVASTKAFTSQITVLYLLSILLGRKKKRLNKKQCKGMLEPLQNIINTINIILKQDKNVREIAEKYYKNNNFLYLGRGLNFPVALEGALKLKEISYVHAEGYPAAEMKHGPIALIDENMPVVFIANKNGAYDKILSNMQEVKARGGKIIALATEGDKEVEKIAEDVIYLPKVIEPLNAITNVIPLQLLAYHIADLRECDIDKPRNLAKSVTVE